MKIIFQDSESLFLNWVFLNSDSSQPIRKLPSKLAIFQLKCFTHEETESQDEFEDERNRFIVVMAEKCD